MMLRLQQRALVFGGLAVFYCLFAGAFCASYGGIWPLIAFVYLFFSKIPNVVLRPPDAQGQNLLIMNWAAMTMLYLGGVFVTVVFPIPPSASGRR